MRSCYRQSAPTTLLAQRALELYLSAIGSAVFTPLPPASTHWRQPLHRLNRDWPAQHRQPLPHQQSLTTTIALLRTLQNP